MSLANPTPDERAAIKAELLTDYARLEEVLAGILARPHYQIRGGELLRGDDGHLVPDPRPARRARQLLATIDRDRDRLTGGARHEEQ